MTQALWFIKQKYGFKNACFYMVGSKYKFAMKENLEFPLNNQFNFRQKFLFFLEIFYLIYGNTLLSASNFNIFPLLKTIVLGIEQETYGYKKQHCSQ